MYSFYDYIQENDYFQGVLISIDFHILDSKYFFKSSSITSCTVSTGRAQALRYVCLDNGIALEEEIVTDWPAGKSKTVSKLTIFSYYWKSRQQYLQRWLIFFLTSLYKTFFVLTLEFFWSRVKINNINHHNHFFDDLCLVTLLNEFVKKDNWLPCFKCWKPLIFLITYNSFWNKRLNAIRDPCRPSTKGSTEKLYKYSLYKSTIE